MNPLNYASLEASRRLVSAGIVLDTDIQWELNENKEWILGHRLNSRGRTIPAPSMAEVWRELPGGSWIHKTCLTNDAWFNEHREGSTNPTDALIDLLIWVRKEKV